MLVSPAPDDGVLCPQIWPYTAIIARKKNFIRYFLPELIKLSWKLSPAKKDITKFRPPRMLFQKNNLI